MNGNFGENVGNDGNAGEISGAAAIEAALQKFGHGENVGAQIKRNEDPAEEKKNQRGFPLEMARREANRGARASQPYEMFGGDVGDEERRTDCEPTDVTTGEEIVFGGALFAREIKSNAENDHEINADDGEINWGQSPVGQRYACR